MGVGLQAAPVSVRSHPLVEYGSRITFIALSVWILERVLTTLFRSQAMPAAIAGSTKLLLLTVSRLVLLSFGFLIALDTVGISITPILASLGVGSVAVALALQDTLGNFFSGIYLLVDKPIRIGDFVKVDEGIEGYVTEIGWRSTHIRMLSNNVVILPNTKIANSKLTNYDLPDKETAVLLQVGVSYDSDLDHVERVTVDVSKEVLGRVTGGAPGFEPFIRYHTLGDSSIDFTVILRAKQFTDQYLLKHEFTKALHARYRQENISIPFPQRVIHVRNEG
jgi:small-conductance mechanosensitive channel